jgi:putative tryptophan/tyrosine transport system substrate-binding protein
MRSIGLAVVLAVGLVLVPVAAEAQQPAKIPRLGYLVLAPLRETPSPERAAFVAGLRELGWIEGKTVAIEYRSAQWNIEFLEDLANELVRMKVDVLVAAGAGPPLLAAKQATSTIPIVMTASTDPIAERLVASLAGPGGNVTGLSSMTPELSSKRLELLKEVMFFDPLSTGYRELVADFAKKHRLPTVFGAREFAEAGGLMSYAPNIAESFRRAATYVDKILRGAKPGDLPIEQPTKFELVINMKTAKALGLTIPQSILVRADQVIE